jgi:hypothetical protein
MKKRVVYVLMLILLMTCVEAATSSVLVDSGVSSVDLKVQILKYLPYPVEPGEYFDLWIGIETQGGHSHTSFINLDDLQNVKLEFVEEYPFTLDPDEEAVKDIGSMRMGEQYIVDYRVKVDENAEAGEQGFKFKITYDNNEITTPELTVKVQSLSNTLNLQSIETEPEQLSPGEPANLSITLSNDAAVDFKNLEVVLAVDGSSIPLVPYKSSKQQNLKSLKVGEKHTFTFSVIPEEDAAAGVYKIPLSITYRDFNNTIFYKNDTFGIMIGAKADLEFNLEEFSAFQKNSKGNVVLSISNVGPTEIKYLNVKLLDGEDYEVIGPNAEYVGNLESDDFETSSFDIYVTARENVPLTFEVTYKDSYNQKFTENVTLELPIYSKSEIGAYGLDGNTTSMWTILLYLVGIYFLYSVYKGWKRDKKIEPAIKHGAKKVIQLPIRIILFFRPSNLKRIPKKIEGLFDDL